MKLKEIYADFHIHIGRTETNRAVKITGAKSLTLENIISFSEKVKGLHMIGIIDCHVPEVIEQLRTDIENKKARELIDGGIAYENLTVILGSEIEIYDEHCQGPIHVLAYLPTLETMIKFSAWLKKRMKNIHLSSQRIYETGRNVQNKVKELGGVFIPAHVFTPFKSLYGKGVVHSLTEVFDPTKIDAIELGLSSDTSMADVIRELHHFTYLSNSDAHSLENIAREYQSLYVYETSFLEWKRALKEEDGRKVIANYGLNPLLGKYHETCCARCFTQRKADDKKCLVCGETKWIKGVSERISELGSNVWVDRCRPVYVHQVPLPFIPKLGAKTLEKLRTSFGTDMDIIHHVSEAELASVAKAEVAKAIIRSREGRTNIQAGGGGKYGKVVNPD